MLSPHDRVRSADLRILRTEQVLPHEIPDPVRERRIEVRLREEGVLRDPIIVGAVEDLDSYILLDGTNRKLALAHLGYPLVLAQVLDYADEDEVQLRTWCHSVALPVDTIRIGAYAIPGLEIEPLHPLGASDALSDSSTLAILLDRRHRFLLSRRPGAVPPRAAQLRGLVDLYEECMTREDCAADQVERRAGSLEVGHEESATLVAFPSFSRGQVVEMAMKDSAIPAGITRHVIQSGRALRVNLPLDALTGTDVEGAQARLRAHLTDAHPRIYREPTILYDS